MAGDRRRLIRAPQRAPRQPAPDDHLATQVTAGLLANKTVPQIARAAGVPRRQVEEVMRSRRVQEALRAAYADAGITPEQVANRLRDVMFATKQVLTPDGAGGWVATREMDWRAVTAAIQLYQSTHAALARLEADEEIAPDAEVVELVSPAEKIGKTSAELFKLYNDRMARQA